jgi:hypothetical protein
VHSATAGAQSALRRFRDSKTSVSWAGAVSDAICASARLHGRSPGPFARPPRVVGLELIFDLLADLELVEAALRYGRVVEKDILLSITGDEAESAIRDNLFDHTPRHRKHSTNKR